MGPYSYRRDCDLDRVSICGYSGTVLAEVAAVMDAHEIKTAKDLNDRLGAVKSPRVTVVDSKNHERVLGSVPRPDRPAYGRSFEFAVLSPVSARYQPMDFETREAISRVSMQLERRTDGWTTEAFFATSAPLDTLVQLRDFRLPNETHNQARARQDVARWS